MNDATAPSRYRIVIRGSVGPRLAELFDDVEIESRRDQSVLTGKFVDQAHLHGLLERLRDFGIPLVSVNPVD